MNEICYNGPGQLIMVYRRKLQKVLHTLILFVLYCMVREIRNKKGFGIPIVSITMAYADAKTNEDPNGSIIRIMTI